MYKVLSALLFISCISPSLAENYLNFDAETLTFKRDERVFLQPEVATESLEGCCERLAIQHPEFKKSNYPPLPLALDEDYFYSMRECEIRTCNTIETALINGLKGRLGLKLVDDKNFIDKVIKEMELCDLMSDCSEEEQLSGFEYNEWPNLLIINAVQTSSPQRGVEIVVAIGNSESGFTVYDVFEQGRVSRRSAMKAVNRLVDRMLSVRIENEKDN